VQRYRTLKQANDPRASDVRAQIKAMKPQIKAARKATREAMLNVLTPDQRALIEQ
jgi:Spy/CpxP family protein refolding chaperone